MLKMHPLSIPSTLKNRIARTEAQTDLKRPTKRSDFDGKPFSKSRTGASSDCRAASVSSFSSSHSSNLTSDSSQSFSAVIRSIVNKPKFSEVSGNDESYPFVLRMNRNVQLISFTMPKLVQIKDIGVPVSFVQFSNYRCFR